MKIKESKMKRRDVDHGKRNKERRRGKSESNIDQIACYLLNSYVIVY